MKYIAKDSKTEETLEVAEIVFEQLIVQAKEKKIPFVVNNFEEGKVLVIDL